MNSYELMRRILGSRVVPVLLVIFTGAPGVQAVPRFAELSGVVLDSQGAVVSCAEVVVYDANRSLIDRATTDKRGEFTLQELPAGSYEVSASKSGFTPVRHAVRVYGGVARWLDVTLSVAPSRQEVTVTAAVGEVQDLFEAERPIEVVNSEEMFRRPANILPQLFREEAGVHVQQTTAHQGAIYLRGLTGQQTVTLIDGVRFNNSTFRPGPNQYQALIDPVGVDRIEIVRGPNSAQYGSDSLGGTVNVLTRSPNFSAGGLRVTAKVRTFFESSNLSGAGQVEVGISSRRFGLMLGSRGQRANDLRAGGGLDSHAAVTRFLGLSSNVLGRRLQDTAFSNYGAVAKMWFRLDPTQQLTLNYQRGVHLGGRRYDRLNGGNGNLISGFDPQTLDFLYLRHEKRQLGFLDSLATTFSWNGIRDDRQTQGGSGNPLLPITLEFNRTDAFGYQVQGQSHLGTRQIMTFGADLYDEHVDSRRNRLDPATGISSGPLRARFPNGAHYQSYGAFWQQTAELFPRRLRLTGGVRYGAFIFKTRSAANPLDASGQPTVLDSSLRTDDLTFNLGGSFFLTPSVALTANVSRGFRAPNVTDLSSLGLTSNGFEVSPTEPQAQLGFVGSTADLNAQSTDRRVTGLESESLTSYEVGTKFRGRRWLATLTYFNSQLSDFISKRVLVLPAGAVGQNIGGQPIIFQDPDNGWVLVPSDERPVIVRTNLGRVRIWGVETSTRVELTRSWSVRANFFYLQGQDRLTGTAPDIEGGLPPATGWVNLLYNPKGRSFWFETYSQLTSFQDRLSSIEMADQRVGASRSRSRVASFFTNGARARGLVGNGADGVAGTTDDVLLATGENLAQVQDRVLGLGVSASSFFSRTAGYATLNFRFGYRVGERSDFLVGVENLLDKNYRVHGSGVDGAGFNAYLAYRIRF